MEDKLQYFFVLFARTTLKLLPFRLRKSFLYKLGVLAYRLDKKHREIVKANLKFAFDNNYSDQEIEEIGKKNFQNFLFYFADFLLSNTRTEEDLKEMIEIEDDTPLKEAIEKGEKIILVSSHHSNFELILKYVGAFYKPLSTVREQLYNSPSLTKLLLTEYIETMNVKAYPKIGAVRHLVKDLKKGRIVALAVDQNTESRHGILINFFGKKARHTATASQVARRFNATLIPVFVTSSDNEKYKMTFFPPIDTTKSDDEEGDILRITQAQADLTEQMAREHVEEYFWMHKRFKNQYPEIYGLK